MKENKRVFEIIFYFFLVLFLFFHPLGIYADNYGVGIYSNGQYGALSTPTPTVTPTPTNTPDNNVPTINSSGGGGTPSASSTCSNQKPTSSPDLFEIDAMSTKVTLYFAPAGKPYSDYYINYGNGSNDEQYSTSFSLSNTTGAIYYTVNKLSQNSIYSFKVRAGNGCAPGSWSKIMKIQTTNGKVVKKYYSSLISYAVSIINNIVSKLPLVNKIIQAEPTIIQQQATTTAPTQKSSTNAIQPTQQTEQALFPTVASTKKKTCFFSICW